MKLAALFATILVLGGCDKKQSASSGKPAPSVPSGATAPANAPTKIAFTAPKVGDVRTEIEDQTMSMNLDTGGATTRFAATTHKTQQIETTAIDGDTTTQLRVTMVEHAVDESVDGKPKPKTDAVAVAGKTYLLARNGKAVTVSLADGSTPSPAEIEAVKSGHDELGRAPTLDKIIAGRTWTPGQRYDLTADELARLNDAPTHADDEPNTTAVALTLERVDGTVATFATELTRAQVSVMSTLTVAMRGRVQLDVRTGDTIEFSGTGTMTGSMGGGEVTGDMTVKTVYRR